MSKSSKILRCAIKNGIDVLVLAIRPGPAATFNKKPTTSVRSNIEVVGVKFAVYPRVRHGQFVALLYNHS